MKTNTNYLIKNINIIILTLALLFSFVFLNLDEDTKITFLSFIYDNLMIVEFVGLIFIIAKIPKVYKNMIVVFLVILLVLSSTYLEYIGVYNKEYYGIIEVSYIAIIIAYMDWKDER